LLANILTFFTLFQQRALHMQLLRILSWIVCGIYATIPCYWMMVHPFAGRWRTARYKLAVLAPLWVGMWCAAWAVSYPWRDTLLFGNLVRNPAGWAAAPLLWAVSIFMYVNAGRELSWRVVIGRHELEPERHPKRLATGGVHRTVRHPMYLGHICTMLGFALGAGTAACLGLFGFALVTGAIMIVFEERELHRRFGGAWEEYCAHTPRIFPLPRRD
jgi:steroid 5-alpha reductase family enzyme